MTEIMEIIIRSAEGAFLQVGSFVGAVLLLFGFINYRRSGEFVKSIERSKKWQPIWGALLGMSPGCGGAIFVMPLYIRETVSFGTVVATLIATMGDSAFVIMSTLPLHYIVVSVVSIIAGVISGYIVDYCDLRTRLSLKKERIPKERLKQRHAAANHQVQILERFGGKLPSDEALAHIGHEEGDEVDIALHHKLRGHIKPETLGYRFTHGGYKGYWALIAIGVILGIMLLFQIDVNALFIPYAGIVIGTVGTLISVIMTFTVNKVLTAETHEEEELKLSSFKETLIHNAMETAFVITWVFIAYLVYEFGVYALGGGNYRAGEEALSVAMQSAGLWSVILGAIIGLIPGCGPQVLFVTLYTKGLVPFAALLANAISQDGDALFPLLAMDTKSAVWATVITTIPALVIGLITYFLF